MKNMKLGSKIGTAIGLVILITMALGTLGILNMIKVGGEAEQLSRQFLPEVKVANELERRALLTMYAIRGYSLSEDKRYLKDGRQNMALLQKALQEARALAQQHPALVTLRQDIDQVFEAAKQYKDMVDQTEAMDQALDAARETMDEAAVQYMKSCYLFLTSQNKAMDAEIKAGAGAERLGERLAKITLVNDVIDLGNTTRIANFKSQTLRDSRLIEDELPNFTKIAEKLAELKKITRLKTNLEQIDEIRAASDSYNQSVQILLTNLAALQELQKQREAMGNDVLRIAQATANAGLRQTQTMADRTNQTLEMVTMVTFVGLLAALGIGIIFAVLTTRNITRPVSATAKAVNLASQGDFRININERHLARGDELGDMMRDVQKMAEDLSNTVREVAQAAGVVAASANEISQGNQDISLRTQNQASAVEETASAIEEMTSSVRQNAENSRQANDLARNTAEMARQGGRVVDSTVEAMAALTESSQKISDITTVVNEIAFQTNLLALNAAVEAVVAGEVRNLAGRSASAAKEIQGLIADSANKVEQGNQLVGQSGRLLGEIIENVQAVADTVAEITASSQEQALGIEEVNKAVAQMDEAVQQNAVVVEEAASSSEQMAAAAEELSSQMGHFRVNRGQSAPRAGLPGTYRQPAPQAEPQAEPQAAHQPAPQPALAPPKAAKARGQAQDANSKKPVEDEFFKVDDLEGFEEF